MVINLYCDIRLCGINNCIVRVLNLSYLYILEYYNFNVFLNKFHFI